MEDRFQCPLWVIQLSCDAIWAPGNPASTFDLIHKVLHEHFFFFA